MTHDHTDTYNRLDEALVDSALEEGMSNLRLNVKFTKADVTECLQKKAIVFRDKLIFIGASIVKFDASGACDFTKTTTVDLITNTGPMLQSFQEFRPKKKYVPPIDFY